MDGGIWGKTLLLFAGRCSSRRGIRGSDYVQKTKSYPLFWRERGQIFFSVNVHPPVLSKLRKQARRERGFRRKDWRGGRKKKIIRSSI